MGTKVCNKCQAVKDLSCYRTVNNKKGSYTCSWCKECERAAALQRYYANRDKLIEDNKKYKKENKERIKQQRQEYLEKNRELIRNSRREYYKQYYDQNRERLNKYIKEYREANPSYKIRGNLRNRLLDCITKSKSTADYLGVPIDIVKSWLEFNFAEDMEWSNYGKVWNIDHTLPVKIFDMDNKDHVYICFDWKNLMPRYVNNNLVKRSKIVPYLILMQERRVREFTKGKDASLSLDIDEYFKMYSQHLTIYFNRKIKASASAT